jgi:hypothetical protein
MWKAREDSDVQPTKDADEFAAPKSQAESVTRQEAAAAKQEAEATEFENEMVDHWIKNPVSTSGFRKSESGLYLID